MGLFFNYFDNYHKISRYRIRLTHPKCRVLRETSPNGVNRFFPLELLFMVTEDDGDEKSCKCGGEEKKGSFVTSTPNNSFDLDENFVGTPEHDIRFTWTTCTHCKK